MVIVMVFMAVTSSGASEMLAVSSLFTFDIYRRYIKPQAGTPELFQALFAHSTATDSFRASRNHNKQAL